MRRSALIVAPLLTLVLLAGCDQGDNNDNNPGDRTDASSDSASDHKGSDSRTDGLESCIVGDWKADPDALDAMGMDTSAFDAFGSDVDVNFVFTFAKGGDFDWNLGFSSAGTMEGVPFSMDGNVTMVGTWKLSGGDQMKLTLDDASGSVTASAAGQEQTQDMDADDLGMADAGVTSMAVTCSGSTLTMGNDASDTIALQRQ